jgi:two-component system, NarL family, nitrate/nitrite response regulator NarL
MRVRLAVLTDDRLLCEGLLKILDAEPTFHVVGNYGAAAHREAQSASGANVLLIDSRISGALDLCARIREHGGPAVILIGAPEDPAWSIRALMAGARGILSRQARAEDLIKAVRAVEDGTIWATRRVMSACISQFTAARATREAALTHVDQVLSAREQDVFRLAARGLGNKALAEQLAISEATVKVHLTHIFQKLGVRGRGELAAAYHGLLHQPDVVRRSA